MPGKLKPLDVQREENPANTPTATASISSSPDRHRRTGAIDIGSKARSAGTVSVHSNSLAFLMKRGPERPRKVGRPRKKPGEPVDHKLTPKMQIAITAIVEDNLPRAEAAKLAGLTDDAVRKAMRDNAAARAFYASEVKALMNFAKAKAAHALIDELKGSNATARVAAARTLLEETTQASAGGNSMPQIPGFAILIADARSSQLPIDVTPLNGMAIAHAPRLQEQTSHG